MPVRDARPEDLSEILAMVQELADYEREPDSVVHDPDEFARNVFGPDAVAHALTVTNPKWAFSERATVAVLA